MAIDDIYGLRPDLQTIGQPDPVEIGDMIRFAGQDRALAIPPEMAGMPFEQEPLPDDFWARLGRGGPQPFNFRMRQKPTGLEVLLALATGFGNARAARGAQRVAETQQRNLEARENARKLATWRWEERKAKQRAIENRELIGARAKAKPPVQSEYEKTRDRIKAFKEAGLPVPGTTPRVGARGGAAPKPSTGQQKSIMGFYLRGKESVDTVSAPEKGGKSLEDTIGDSGVIEQGRMKFLPNMLKSDEQQRYTQAQRAFTEARLRKESGAAINASEYENDARIYFVQPGDKPPVRAQKKRLRQKVLDGLKFGAGSAFDEYYKGQQAPDGLSEEDAYRIYLETVGGS